MMISNLNSKFAALKGLTNSPSIQNTPKECD